MPYKPSFLLSRCLFMIAFALGCSLQVHLCEAHPEHSHEDEKMDLEGRVLESLKNSILKSLPTKDRSSRITVLQEALRKSGFEERRLNELGWAFVELARRTQNESYYGLVQSTTEISKRLYGESDDVLLLRGHTLLQQHRFKEVESLAHKLAKKRGLPSDLILLGDALMEQGRLLEAASAYQAAVNQRPDLSALARVARLRWLTGDAEGSIDAWHKALRVGFKGDEEAFAWCASQLGETYLATGDLALAESWADAALRRVNDYGHATFLKGKARWFSGQENDSEIWIRKAIEIDPLPERQWWLEDVLQRQGRRVEAEAISDSLMLDGSNHDARGLALYLASRGVDMDRAMKLAEEEIEMRSDSATLDVLGLVQMESGHMEVAQESFIRALDTGIQDGRLLLHVGTLEFAKGNHAEALQFFEDSNCMKFQMTPSEIEVLNELMAEAKASLSANRSTLSHKAY